MVNESLIKAEPAEQNYSAAPIHVAEHISTSDSVTNNISAQNKLLNSVNNLTRGGKRRMKKGGRTKSKFFEEAKFFKAGEIDPSSNYGWTFRADCYNMEISKLKPLDKLRK